MYDASKCNFLRHDLGFLWHDGRRYTTGTGDENYRFGYVRGALAKGASGSDAIYGPYVTALRQLVYLGGANWAIIKYAASRPSTAALMIPPA